MNSTSLPNTTIADNDQDAYSEISKQTTLASKQEISSDQPTLAKTTPDNNRIKSNTTVQQLTLLKGEPQISLSSTTTNKITAKPFYTNQRLNQTSLYLATQKQRLDLLEKQCQQYRPKDLHSWYPGKTRKVQQLILRTYLERGFLDVNAIDVVACIPPKTGTSNWQRVFMHLTKNITIMRAMQLQNAALYKGLTRIHTKQFQSYRAKTILAIKRDRDAEINVAFDEDEQQEHIDNLTRTINGYKHRLQAVHEQVGQNL